MFLLCVVNSTHRRIDTIDNHIGIQKESTLMNYFVNILLVIFLSGS
jgi:hypothetical protein